MSLIYANSRAKAQEINILSQERINRMAEATSPENAVRVLMESNYGGGVLLDNFVDYEIMLKNEENITCKFIKEVTPENIGLEGVFLMKDYFNLKALIKNNFINVEIPLLENGTFSEESLKKQLKDGQFENLFMQRAFDDIYKFLEVYGENARVIDVTVDKYMFLNIINIIGSKKTDSLIKEYFIAYIDVTNLACFMRTKKIDGDFKLFAQNFISGGKLPLEGFEKAYSEFGYLYELTKGTEYYKLIDNLEDLTLFDVKKEDYLLDIINTKKYDMFTIAPLFGYYLAKNVEIKNIRIILTCLKNNVSKEEIKKRLRKLYA